MLAGTHQRLYCLVLLADLIYSQQTNAWKLTAEVASSLTLSAAASDSSI